MPVQDIKSWTLWWSFILKADKMLKMEGHLCPRNPSQIRKHLKRQTVGREDSVCCEEMVPLASLGQITFKNKQNSKDKCVSPQRSRAISSYPPQNICSQSLRNNSTLHPDRFAWLHIQAHTFKSKKLTPWVFKLTVGHDIRLGWSNVVLASYGRASTYVGLVDTENVSSLSFLSLLEYILILLHLFTWQRRGEQRSRVHTTVSMSESNS